ncbi:MAG: 3-dehydroquinate synthase [Flavipsychrobacter sp.]|jgi:3-dehydroquinate synthase|nr:3-dehydroquinate synthase [Flavipsychrobacter sp.]
MQQTVTFPSGTVHYHFQSSFAELWTRYDKEHAVIITNEYIAKQYAKLLKGYKLLVIPVGEHSKNPHTITFLAKELLNMEATRKTMLVGIGGGVVTDIVGMLGSIYMRGVPFGFIPTTLLGMVDAAVGGKNGINVGLHKNILGAVAQPRFILYDPRFLDTLPDDEWSNGFAEIIKCACIFDAELFAELQKNNISYYKDHNDDALQVLIQKCVALKNKTVVEDEKETGLRKLLNFGHTAAHAIENLYEIPHGKAVGIGMVIAARVSSQVAGLNEHVVTDLEELLGRYHLPISLKIDAKKAIEIMRMDKKRSGDMMDYIVLEKIGKAAIRSLPLTAIEKALFDYESDN